MTTTEHPKKERTLVIVKPDGIQRSLMGEIIKRYEQAGYKLVATKLVLPTAEQAKDHYMVGGEEWLESVGVKASAAYEKKGMKSPFMTPRENGLAILETNAKYLSSGPVLAMVWQGAHVVEVIRKLTGGTEPRSSEAGSIRGDFVHDSYMISDTDNRSIRNLIHASGSAADAEKEIRVWFHEHEMIDYRLINEAILYDVNLDGILD
ncbi:nucleoside-diphosphate kinase [Patescibacteria group bacterium]|nr:nucleoside-diphosphate kinase [Patescibacteria group bacterium]